ncbi:replication protein A 70 kDa DNA-binding subunit B-like isoform X1 [Solanum stenotomum]|uniref:replication protein A 70 kDa DNA-binding subunit B-like isoform X1 n=1 Tax=Solanum stenotomum TaxID=172797 RepID=UPI0020D10F28|nr:replication protein A 70 kDa DNA-binding subunit B-like isoform X1 [Solanum stenotomum]XP_049399428.1 replication protein A 70 kDa DNA-binding subunit B-like isoform X1 [Solanum stenotomum]
MVLRVNIAQIEPATRDWICKVQIVEIGRPRESLDKKCTFQNLILEDEEECQIKVVMYADEIEQYADKLKLLHTYLISTARVKVSPTSYGKPIHKFYWILDKETVIEQIKPSHEVEKPLPLPTKLNITSFDCIPHLMVDSAVEIDILAIVLRCGPQKNAGRSHHRCREITLCDNQKNQFLFTLWEDFGEIEGHEIASKMATEADLLVILGRSIGISTYQGLSLQTRYNSTVRVNSNYPQAVALINWAKENKTMLLSCPSEKTSTSSSIAPMIVTTAGQQLISIAEISSAPSMGVFYVEAEMAVLDEFQDFCVLECSGCKQKKRTKDRKDFECPKCNRKTTLVPRCSFQIDIIDNTATTTASISAELGEKLLSMTAEDIFDITCTKRQSLSLNHVHEMLSDKVFKIQLRKSFWASSNTTHATLSILSYMEKQHAPQTTTDRTSKKIKPLEISEVEVMATTTAVGSSNAPPKFEPPTPTKKV